MTPTEKAIRDFCGHHADWWPSTTQVQEMLALAQPCHWLLESTQTLAKTLAREFYPEVTQWECLNDLAGVISQIDHMTTGLMRKPKHEPVACVYKATTKKGETAHFGEYSAAKAWAGWGTVEQVPLKTLTFISKSIKPCSTCEALARAVMLDQTSHDTQRKPLRDHEIVQILDRERMKWNKSPPTGEFDLAFARAIEAAHGIKETEK